MNIFRSRWFRGAQATLLAALGIYTVYLGQTSGAPHFSVAGLVILAYSATILWFVLKAGRHRR